MNAFIRRTAAAGCLRWLPAAVLALACAGAAAQVVAVPDAHLNHAEGSVAYAPHGDQEWHDIAPKRLLRRGDRLWTDHGSRAEVQAGGHALRIDGRTQLTLDNVTDAATQLSVTQGSVVATVTRVAAGDSFEVGTPNLALRARQPGDYRIDVDPKAGTTRVVVLSGNAVVYGEQGEAQELKAGQRATFRERGLAKVKAPLFAATDDFDRWAGARRRGEPTVRMPQVASAPAPRAAPAYNGRTIVIAGPPSAQPGAKPAGEAAAASASAPAAASAAASATTAPAPVAPPAPAGPLRLQVAAPTAPTMLMKVATPMSAQAGATAASASAAAVAAQAAAAAQATREQQVARDQQALREQQALRDQQAARERQAALDQQQRQRAEAQRRAEEQRKAVAARQAEQARRAEDERRQQAQARREQEQRRPQARRVDAEKRQAHARRADDQRLAAARREEDRRLAQARRIEAQKQALAQAQARKVEERRLAEARQRELTRLQAQAGRDEQAAREAQARREQAARRADEERREELARREEQARREELARRDEEARRDDQDRRQRALAEQSRREQQRRDQEVWLRQQQWQPLRPAPMGVPARRVS